MAKHGDDDVQRTVAIFLLFSSLINWLKWHNNKSDKEHDDEQQLLQSTCNHQQQQQVLVNRNKNIMVANVDKGKLVARCLGYQHAFQDSADEMNDLVGDIVSSIVCSMDASTSNSDDDGAPFSTDVDMWHLRSLAIEEGGLLNSHGRKLGYVKLAGVDDLVFDGGDKVNDGAPSPDDKTYDQIREQLERDMEPSRWHIQRERKYLRKGKKKHRNDSLSRASSVTDLSSIGSDTGSSSTPLTANLNPASRAGTPRSTNFQEGLGGSSIISAASFTSFATAISNTTSKLPLTVDTTIETVNTTTTTDEAADSPSTNNTETPTSDPTSPLLLSLSPVSAPLFAPDPSFVKYKQKYQQKYDKQMTFKPRMKKDRRPKEKKLLVQIATSTFYLLQQQQGLANENGYVERFQFFPGSQDLIAVLLLHLESPSLTSLLFQQIIKSHLWMFCSSNEDVNESFKNCLDGSESDDIDSTPQTHGSVITDDQNLDILSLSFFPLLRELDKDVYDSLTHIICGSHDSMNSQALAVGKVLQKWIASWFCCHDMLPLEVVSRLIDLFLASHYSMPLYLSIAITCHPINRDRFVGSSDIATMLDSLFLNLPAEFNNDMKIIDFIEEAISTAVGFMKQVKPHSLLSLLEGYENGTLKPHLSPQVLERESSPAPWTSRSLAPTDHKMVGRLVSDIKVGPSNQLARRHQLALDASGLSPSSNSLSDAFDCDRMRGLIQIVTPGQMTASKAALFGFALFASVQLLKLNQEDPFDYNNVAKLLSEDESFAPNSAVSAGLQSLLSPLNHAKPQALDCSEVKSTLSSGLSSLGDSAVLTSVDMPKVVDTNTLDVEGLFNDLLIGQEVNVDDATWENIPSKNTIWPYHKQASANRYDSENPSSDNDGEGIVYFASQDESRTAEEDENQHLLVNNNVSGEKRVKGQTLSRHNKIKRYTPRNLKTRTIQSIKGIRKEYISLVDSNDVLI